MRRRYLFLYWMIFVEVILVFVTRTDYLPDRCEIVRYLLFFSLEGVILKIHIWTKYVFWRQTLRWSWWWHLLLYWVLFFLTHLSPFLPYLSLNIWMILLYSDLVIRRNIKKNGNQIRTICILQSNQFWARDFWCPSMRLLLFRH